MLVTSPWGVIVTYINERFVTDVRATGFGVGFSLSVIIPSFYAFYMNWLGVFMPLRLTPVVLLCRSWRKPFTIATALPAGRQPARWAALARSRRN